MKPIAPLVTVVAAFVLALTLTPSWGQPVCVAPGCNPTVSDRNANTAGGTDALVNVVTSGEPQGFNNTAFGVEALKANTSGNDNTASGANALQFNTTGSSNTATGGGALGRNATGSNNTASGFQALFNNASGSVKTAIGFHALVNNISGSSNTATGGNALVNNNGNSNTATGESTLVNNVTGSNNTATGVNALANNTTGSSNTATGIAALESNTSGNDNTASGNSALGFNTTGNNNTAVGAKALLNSTGHRNIALGFKAGVTLTTGNNNIYIGNPGAGDESQTIRIGTAQAQTFIAGIGATPVNGAIVMVDSGTGQLGIGPPSSARYKQDIAPIGTQSDAVLQLRPVTFAYRDDVPRVKHYGLVAEEVAAVYPELVTHTATGEVQTVKYHELIPMLLNELQREHQALQDDRAELASLRKELTELRSLVGSRLGQ